MRWANSYDEIENTLNDRQDLKDKMITLIKNDDIAGKSIEENNRLLKFKDILISYVSGKISFTQAINLIELNIPPNSSKYYGDKRVFPSNWSERLLRIQFSRFYNQAVMTILLEQGEIFCFIPSTPTQKPESNCSKYLTNKKHKISELYDKLINSYSKGIYTKEPKIPDHLNCSHVVKPLIN